MPSLAKVGVESVKENRNVDIHNVAFLEGSSVGNSVADDLINGSAAGLGEFAVVEGRGVASKFEAFGVHHSIDFFSRHSSLCHLTSSLQNGDSHIADDAKFFDIGSSMLNRRSSMSTLAHRLSIGSSSIVGL